MQHWGLMGFEVELGIAENAVMEAKHSLGFSADKTEDATLKASYTRETLKFWDGRGRDEPLCVDWAAFEHPQLGRVEIGGMMETPHMNVSTVPC
jgi:hypothetical protein